MDNYRELHIIMPVKDSIETVREALNCLYTSSDLNWQFTLYNDYSTPENTEALRQLAGHYEFELVNWAERTKHPSPNYRFTLIDAQRKALQEQADLLIIESDVLIRRDTIVRIRTARQDRVGMVAAITHDEHDKVNFPYKYAALWRKKPTFTIKRFSFCCTLLTKEFLQTYSFEELNPEKDWFDVAISRRSLEYGFRNLLLMDTPVLHKPHSSRPWKMLKYTNPIKYYLLKFLHRRDKI
ncbi:MAG: glycosyltransferase family 2 protein [Paludibacteraceae bacterium]|nr:glycosyltransferase family 2 protein [Paludibacteraceae bacterium]